jgi:hypothetical protein
MIAIANGLHLMKGRLSIILVRKHNQHGRMLRILTIRVNHQSLPLRLEAHNTVNINQTIPVADVTVSDLNWGITHIVEGCHLTCEGCWFVLPKPGRVVSIFLRQGF